MSKKTIGFDLINSDFKRMSTCVSLLHNNHLASFDLYVQSSLHHVSKHDLILTTNEFIDQFMNISV